MTVTALGSGLVLVPDRPRRALLVFFHGAGGDASQSLAVVRPHAAGLLVYAPSSASTTWDLLRGGLGADADAVDAAVAALTAEHGVDTVGYAGFSDGASYALSLGLARGVDAVLAFSPGSARLRRSRAGRASGSPTATPTACCRWTGADAASPAP